MAKVNPSQLKERLAELLEKLEKFDRWLESDLKTLDGAWARLDEVWDGVAYEEFTGNWTGVHSILQQYTMLCRMYEEFLREHIRSLIDVEKSGGAG